MITVLHFQSDLMFRKQAECVAAYAIYALAMRTIGELSTDNGEPRVGAFSIIRASRGTTDVQCNRLCNLRRAIRRADDVLASKCF